MTVLELHQFQSAEFTDQLIETVEQAPAFFQQTPVIISLEKLESDQGDALDLGYIQEICRKHGLIPVALRGDAEQSGLAAEHGLAFIPVTPRGDSAAEPSVTEAAAEESASAEPSQAESSQPEPATADSAPAAESQPAAAESEPQAAEAETASVDTASADTASTKVIHHPVRSGQQVYAKGGDLIVLASVSEGAEVLADGNIHVYGALRGRALAGVLGDENARIFCQSMEAELISIAGHFKLSDDLKNQSWRRPAQMHFSSNTLHVETL